MGSYMKERLRVLRKNMTTDRYITDRKLKTPAQEETVHIMDQMKELGVLIGKGGYFGNVFRTPSLCFTKDDAGT
ncbi:hypothetical protein SLEP1_g54527 [Rubroshorea leprosula]|uniref:Uncharacterized protein n=1 Tax=Rubroshorea leprosula TaxID=152421 RepID=A0AAV5MGC9_9ROSI|nr:hypothetical protein SLEP1_g54527 [Rubroshorea leprosula]